MQVIINGEPHQVTGPLSLAQAVALLTSSQSGLAAAVNGDVVRRAAWNSTTLSDGDEVEVLTAVQGG
ncbi:MAG TPA: sulfur carrier protein ThiS [Streptosporangiaceae bacterium]|nr:sulfur carrier protein ThiS [Streptosporangiaceae bacterium]